MFSYHAVALSGSDAYAATSVRGRSISISVRTSTATGALAQLRKVEMQRRADRRDEDEQDGDRRRGRIDGLAPQRERDRAARHSEVRGQDRDHARDVQRGHDQE